MAVRRNTPARFNGNGIPAPLMPQQQGNVGSTLPNAKVSTAKKTSGTGPNFDFVHPDYARYLPQWEATRVAVEGEPALTRAPWKYLPDPTPLDECAEARSRYASYCVRATYLNATGRTKAGLIGIAFSDWPEVVMPKSMEYLIENADGAGMGLYGLCQHTVGEDLETGRGGLFVDYPKVVPGDSTSIQDRTNGTVARIIFYKAEDIRDWAQERVGTEMRLSYVKLYEERDRRTLDGYSLETIPMYRILRLRDGIYTVEVLEKLDSGWTSTGELIPLDATGTAWDLIPFHFVGAESNLPTPAKPPLYDLGQVNLGHYRNSADFEESVFMLGQPQVTMTGLDQAWRDHIEAAGVYFGSRRVLLGPVGATIGILQVEPNTLAREAMKDKEVQMVSLGARLLQPGSVNKTEHQSKADTRAAYSVLSLVCDNVSQAYKSALLWVQRYMGASGEVDFAIDTDFDGLTFNTEIVNTMVKAVQAGLIPESEAWRVLRGMGLIDPEKTDEEIREEIDAASESAMQMQAALGLTPGPPAAPGGAKPEAPAPADE